MWSVSLYHSDTTKIRGARWFEHVVSIFGRFFGYRLVSVRDNLHQ